MSSSSKKLQMAAAGAAGGGGFEDSYRFIEIDTLAKPMTSSMTATDPNDGSIYTAWGSKAPDNFRGISLIKVDIDGNLVFYKEYTNSKASLDAFLMTSGGGYNSDTSGTCMDFDSEGNLYMGIKAPIESGTYANAEVQTLLKIDPTDGSIIWYRALQIGSHNHTSISTSVMVNNVTTSSNDWGAPNVSVDRDTDKIYVMWKANGNPFSGSDYYKWFITEFNTSGSVTQRRLVNWNTGYSNSWWNNNRWNRNFIKDGHLYLTGGMDLWNNAKYYNAVFKINLSTWAVTTPLYVQTGPYNSSYPSQIILDDDGNFYGASVRQYYTGQNAAGQHNAVFYKVNAAVDTLEWARSFEAQYGSGVEGGWAIHYNPDSDTIGCIATNDVYYSSWTNHDDGVALMNFDASTGNPNDLAFWNFRDDERDFTPGIAYGLQNTMVFVSMEQDDNNRLIGVLPMDNTYATGTYSTSTTGFDRDIYYNNKTNLSIHIGTNYSITLQNSNIAGTFNTISVTNPSYLYYYNWSSSNISFTESSGTTSYIRIHNLS